MKKVMTLLLVLVIFTTFTSNLLAIQISPRDNDEKILIQNGLAKENLEALSNIDKEQLIENLKKDKSKVQINSVIMEIDNLAEIEAFMSRSRQELIESGADSDKVDTTRKELERFSTLSEEKLAKELNTSIAEARYIKRAIEQGRNMSNDNQPKEIKEQEIINASGSISSTTLTYSQAVTNLSTATRPIYKVNVAYTWNTVYALSIYSDAIAACWGGGLVTSGISSAAAYYDSTNSSFASYNKTISMTKEETIQAGIKFRFPQAVMPKNPAYPTSKTRNGSATFTIYQLQKQGYATQVASRYCHRSIRLESTSISFSTSPTVSINVGGAWDTSAQRISTISY
ncbi:MAG: hypothetical protein FD141_733 [Fusobacteria bacterium]|nr:MAG: hypothetical protein FD141_733 [Fusobacteriota bacterium]KAF0228601.1 MAG: hypothetical protein FD182_857 [Fusobacteriota bacterium]